MLILLNWEVIWNLHFITLTNKHWDRSNKLYKYLNNKHYLNIFHYMFLSDVKLGWIGRGVSFLRILHIDGYFLKKKSLFKWLTLYKNPVNLRAVQLFCCILYIIVYINVCEYWCYCIFRVKLSYNASLYSSWN